MVWKQSRVRARSCSPIGSSTRDEFYDPAIPEKFLRDNTGLLPAGITEQNLVITQDVQARVLFFRLDLPDTVEANP